MLEESIWASMNSWFTPTVLFVLLNIVIATIAITSSIASQKHKDPQQQQQQQQPLNRAPSLLYRLRSIDFYRYSSETPISSAPPDPQPQHPDPPPPQQQQQQHEHSEESDSEEEDLMERFEAPDDDHHHQVTRSVSDTKPASGEVPVKLAMKMRKSASVKSAFSHFEDDREAEERRRPSTVREVKKKLSSADLTIDEEVDAKADDFINRFKQQLKLQRLDSLIRYKEMITRGAK